MQKKWVKIQKPLQDSQNDQKEMQNYQEETHNSHNGREYDHKDQQTPEKSHNMDTERNIMATEWYKIKRWRKNWCMNIIYK